MRTLTPPTAEDIAAAADVVRQFAKLEDKPPEIVKTICRAAWFAAAISRFPTDTTHGRFLVDFMGIEADIREYAELLFP